MNAKARKDIGVGSAAPEGRCSSKDCPWHGSLAVRGRVFKGIVSSAKSSRSVTVVWDYLTFVPKYERYSRKRTRISAHNPECIAAKEGDVVIIAECRPLSKTKSFVVVEKAGAAEQPAGD